MNPSRADAIQRLQNRTTSNHIEEAHVHGDDWWCLLFRMVAVVLRNKRGSKQGRTKLLSNAIDIESQKAVPLTNSAIAAFTCSNQS